MAKEYSLQGYQVAFCSPTANSYAYFDSSGGISAGSRTLARRVLTETGSSNMHESTVSLEGFHRSEGKWLPEANPRPLKVEQVPFSSQLLPPFSENSTGGSSQRLLDGEDRPQGCVLAHSGQRGIPEIPGLPLEGENILLHSSSLWSLPGSGHISRDDLLPTTNLSGKGNLLSRLPRRHHRLSYAQRRVP